MLMAQINQNLLAPNGLDQEFLENQAQQLLMRQIDFCDLYLQNSTTESFALDEGIIKSASFAINQGIGIRAIVGEKSFLSYSNAISPKSIKSLVDGIFIEPKNQLSQTSAVKSNLINKSPQIPTIHTIENSITTHSHLDKISILKSIDTIARSNPYVTNVITNLSLEYDEICIIRSDNRVHGDIRPLIHLSITIVINQNGKIEKGNSGLGGRYTLDKLSPEKINFHIDKAYQLALLKLEASTAPKGQMPVVLGNGWAGVILHEAVGHGLEGDFNRKGSSAFSNKIGMQVASNNVTIIDEGSIPNRRGSLNIDDEGNHTKRNVLIENGVLREYMFDELNARLVGKTSTGNGRRESFACCPMPRMTNTYMLGGEHHPEEIIASIENGIYADNFEGGQVDITSGQFVFNASIAWVIKNGKLTHPVKGCALVGNGPECLKYVSMVGNDMELDSGIGMCGKNGQSVPVGVGQPTIRIDNGLVVGGAD